MDLTTEHSALFTSLVALIRSASSVNALDVGFLRSLDRRLAESSESQSARLLNLLNRLVSVAPGAHESDIRSVDDLISRWTTVEHSFDALIDRIDLALNPRTIQANEMAVKPSTKVVTHDRSIQKPQEKFDTPIDNTLGAFRPLLTQKPHASVLGLAESLAVQAPDSEHENEWYDQPYRREIAAAPYPKSFWNVPAQATEPRPFGDTPLTWVDTPRKLQKMLSKLRKAQEIAVDLEHHDYRSYLGLVCLMQISTRDEDWLVDTLALRTELQVLNEVFCNPKIIKVLHGARMDIQWLQRDLGVYVVGLFDTHSATRALGLPRHSLAYLLEKYAQYTADKQYQLADWRVRPLTPELVDYARADTHFLLYTYDRLRADLQDRGLLEVVVAESRVTAALRYEKPGYNLREPAWLPLALKHRLLGRTEQAILAKVYEWRENKARENDESPRYIMPNHFLANLCVVQPAGPAQLVGLSHHVTPFVREAAATLITLIQEAKKAESIRNEANVSGVPRDHGHEDVFSYASIDAARSLRLNTPHIFGENVPIIAKDTPVFLGVVKMDDVQRVAKEVEGAEDDSEKATVPAESESNSDSARSSPEPVERKRISKKGKRINIVDSADQLPEQQKPKRHRVVKDEPAFDFEAAEPILQQAPPSPSRSYRQFRNQPGSQSKGASGPPRKGKARSFRT